MSKLRSPWREEDARSLVRRTAAIRAAPAGAKTRVFARVEALVASPGGEAGADASASRGPTHPSSAPFLPGGTRALAILAAFVVGGGVGAAVMYRIAHAPAAVEATRSASLEHDLPVSLEGPSLPSPAVSAPSVEGVAPSASPSPPAATLRAQPIEPAMPIGRERPGLPSETSLRGPSSISTPVADERTLLDAARVAVEREDGDAALAATEAHARKYPHGVLVQEREAIAVRALTLLGRTDEARARVDRFRDRFPNSLLLPALESSVRR